MVVLSGLSCCDPGQYFDSLVDGRDRIDVKQAVPDGLHDLTFQDQVPEIVLWNDDSLRSVETSGYAKVKEAFDLVSSPTDGLYIAVLINRPCNPDALG